MSTETKTEAPPTLPASIQLGRIQGGLTCTVRFPHRKQDADRTSKTMSVFAHPEDLQAIIKISSGPDEVRPLGSDTYHSPAKPFVWIKTNVAQTKVTGARTKLADIRRGDNVVLGVRPVKYEYDGKIYLALRAFAIHVASVYQPPTTTPTTTTKEDEVWEVEGFQFQ